MTFSFPLIKENAEGKSNHRTLNLRETGATVISAMKIGGAQVRALLNTLIIISVEPRRVSAVAFVCLRMPSPGFSS
jgi:hypothetical protein